MNLLDKETITVLLADDHSLIRQGIMLILEEIEVDAKVTQASNLQQITEQISANKIDIAVIDAHFPDGNSITILPEIKTLAPEIRILIFTGIDEAANALKFLKAGANGFISKMSEEEEIKNAIKQKPSVSIDEIKKGLEMARNFIMPMMYFAIIMMNLLIGLIVSLITGLIMKKEKKAKKDEDDLLAPFVIKPEFITLELETDRKVKQIYR